MPKLGAGWLGKGTRTDNLVGAIAIDKEKFPTRHQEYNFVIDALANEPRGLVIDAGCGYNYEIHVLDYALADVGFYVMGTDANPEMFNMPPHNKVVRYHEDIIGGWFTRGIEADFYCCVSTLEHLQPMQQLCLLETAFATLKPSGYALFTVDLMPPYRLNGLLKYAGFETGEVEPIVGEHLTPRVAWAIGRKPL